MLPRFKSILRQCEISDSDLLVVLEDDGRVAYAYLKDHGVIVADVWLYNVAETPEKNNWHDKTQLPFLNPRKYCTAGVFERITEQSQVNCTLVLEHVEIRMDGRLIARLKPGAKPGWSRLAACDGPLARPLDRART